MFKLAFLAAALALLGLALGSCSDAGDPYVPGEAGVSATVRVTDLVGDWDNLHLDGTLTGDTPVAMTQDGPYWSASVSGLGPGTYGYGIYHDDGTLKAMVPVLADQTITVSSSYVVGGDLQVTLEPAAGTGFKLMIYNNNPAYSNIKIKGMMNDWDPEITGSNAAGTAWFLHVEAGLAAGNYQWGVIEDDGSEWGIWLLPPGPNLLFTVDAEGAVTGDTSFTVPSPEPVTTLTLNCDMNDFAGSYSTVSVRGTFNNWDTTPTQMTDADSDGIYTVVLDVEQNQTVVFKFITDGANYESVPPACGVDDQFGGYNRTVEVGSESAVYTTKINQCPAEAPTR